MIVQSRYGDHSIQWHTTLIVTWQEMMVRLELVVEMREDPDYPPVNPPGVRTDSRGMMASANSGV